VSESLSGAATSSGHYGATAVIKVADAGLSVGKAVAKMQELEDIILTGLALEAAKRYKALPKFSNILHSRHGVPVLPARAIEEHLADKGILQPSALMTSREQAPKYLTGEILADKDFEGGWARVTPTLGQNRKSSANVIASPTSSTTNTTTSSTTSIAPQPYEYSDFTADELEEEALPFSQDELKEYELESPKLINSNN